MRRPTCTTFFLMALLILTACGPSSEGGISVGKDPPCADTDPHLLELQEIITNLEGADESYAQQLMHLLWEMESFLALLPIQKPDGACTVRETDWSQRCGTAKFEVPLHVKALYCQQKTNGADLMRPPSEELELPAAPLVHVQQVNGSLSGPRTVHDEDPDTVGRVPVEVSIEVCDEYDENGVCISFHLEWVRAPFHYEVRAEILFHDVVAFLTDRLECIAPSERCPPGSGGDGGQVGGSQGGSMGGRGGERGGSMGGRQGGFR